MRAARGAWIPVLTVVAAVSACGGARDADVTEGTDGAPGADGAPSDVGTETTGSGHEGPATLARMTEGTDDYCALPEHELGILAHRPSAEEDPVDDVNWFARPVPHDGDEWIIAFASHDQNYLYDLSNGVRIRIPDRSDAVATPDGRYMTVPSYYTADSTVRFYPVDPMLEALRAQEDADALEPAYVHDDPALSRVYYQSTALVVEEMVDDRLETTYRLMFSGTNHESEFRIVDYVFTHDAVSGDLLDAAPSAPMTICPAVDNDLNTPFISKDGRYVAAYTSGTPGNAYTPGASLKIFEITSTDPATGTTTCRLAVDLGFAAGKADFSFDGSMLAFHLSQGAYLTPFVNGGLPETTITDVMVARLDRDADGRIVGYRGLQRLSTSLTAGVGSYFPAFFPDGNLFFLSNRVPRQSEREKRFDFRVVDPGSRGWRNRTLASNEDTELWAALGALWERACMPALPTIPEGIFPLDEHELPLQAMSLTVPQCTGLVEDARADPESGDHDWGALLEVCGSLES